MYISRLELKNWRNFKKLDISLKERTFIIGANATGKSNLLDAFRFLRDLVSSGGGLRAAVQQRKGVSRIRCLNTRQDPAVGIAIEVSEFGKEGYVWKYSLEFRQEPNGKRRVLLTKEELWNEEGKVFSRPDRKDEEDSHLLTQTHLEQLTQNAKYRDLAEVLEGISYFHLVPQLLRYPEAFGGQDLPSDPFGRGFLGRIALTPEKTRKRYLTKISTLLGDAVPQLKGLDFTRDEQGLPHLSAVYEHWRPKAGKQDETQFSDGTLRLIALLWLLCENHGITLLEEPELSLHREIVARLPELFHIAQKRLKKKRQFIITTHSQDLLADPAIALSEIQVLFPTKEGTECKCAADSKEWVELMRAGGMTPAEIVLPATRPHGIDQLSLTFME